VTTEATIHPLFDGPLPDGWRLLTVDDIKSPEKSSCVAGPFGSNISSKYFVGSGVPVIRGGNLRDDLTRFVPEGFAFVSEEQATKYKAQHVRSGDLVFTCWGTVGQVGLIPSNGPFPEYIISNKQLKLRPNLELADPVFLFFYFAGPKMVQQVLGRAIGAAVPGINLGILKALPVVLPPLPVQRQIAGILSAYDELMENSQRRIRRLEAMARALYREWFVHFRFPGHEKLPRVASPLGDIPQGWEVEPFSALASYVNGYAFKPDDWGAEGKPIVKIKELKAGITAETPRNPGDGIPAKYNVRDGDVLFSWSADLDTYLWMGGEGLLNQHLFNVVPFDGLSRAFCFHALKESMPRFRALSLGATMQHIKRSALDQVFTLLPPAALRKRFEVLVEPMHQQLITLSKHVQNLRRTRDHLLPRLLSGSVPLKTEEN
jgi:type I restriction enzyme, S subunit